MKTITTTVMMDKPEAEACDARIRTNIEQSIKDLQAMREREGWRALGYDTWTAYTKSYTHSRQHIYKLLAAAEVAEDVGRMLPASQSVELKKLPREERKPALEEAEESAKQRDPEATVTTADVKQSVASRRHSSVDPEAVTSGKKAETVNPKVAAALDYLERVIGKSEAKAIRQGVIALSDREVLFWSGQDDASIKRLATYVIGQRMAPTAAHRFITQVIDEKTTINTLNLMAVKEPFRVQVAGFTTITFNRRDHKDAEQKIERILGIKD